VQHGQVALLCIRRPHLCYSLRPPTQALRSRRVSSGIEASRCTRIPSLPAEPPVLVLWPIQVTRQFCDELPQTSRADSGRELLPCTDSSRRLRLAFLATMRPALDPAGHWVPRAEPTCLSTPWRPCNAKTFRACSSPAPMQIKPQPTPAILNQESVHTTLSITHHTRKRPSTGPQTLWTSTATSGCSPSTATSGCSPGFDSSEE
jgi:hypothetical protein